MPPAPDRGGCSALCHLLNVRVYTVVSVNRRVCLHVTVVVSNRRERVCVHNESTHTHTHARTNHQPPPQPAPSPDAVQKPPDVSRQVDGAEAAAQQEEEAGRGGVRREQPALLVYVCVLNWWVGGNE